MNLKHRINALEGRAPDPGTRYGFVVLDGTDDSRAQERHRELREKGHPVRVIRVEVRLQAEDETEAERVLAEHREAHPTVPATVYRDPRTGVDEILAEWSPPLPEWLGAASG